MYERLLPVLGDSPGVGVAVSFRNEFRSEREMVEDFIRRLDDLERADDHPFRWDPDLRELYWIVPRTGEEVLVCTEVCCPCEEAPIWLCTTLREGDTTWTSLGGDTRTLDPEVAEHTADGGISIGPNTGLAPSTFYDPGDTSDLPSGLYRMTMEVSTDWTYVDGWESYGFIDSNDWNFRVAILNPGWWDTTPDPAFYAAGDGTGSPTALGIVSNPATVGLSGWARGRMRIEYDSATGDLEFFLANRTGAFVSQGTATVGVGAVGSGLEFSWAENGPYFSPQHWTRPVIHAVEVVNAGVTILDATEADINAIRPPFQPGVELIEDYAFGPGDYVLRHGSGVQASSSHSISPNGSPIFIRQRVFLVDPQNTYVPRVFTDGPDLGSPAIAWADRLTPGLIEIANEQPSAWEPPDGAFVYAVADLAGFTDITNGWPTGYWPFGSIIGAG